MPDRVDFANECAALVSADKWLINFWNQNSMQKARMQEKRKFLSKYFKELKIKSKKGYLININIQLYGRIMR